MAEYTEILRGLREDHDLTQAQVAAVTAEAVNDAVRRRMPKSFAAGADMRVFEVSGTLGK